MRGGVAAWEPINDDAAGRGGRAFPRGTAVLR